MALRTELAEYENDPRLFLFTSLTAGSSHTITATSRMETILKANRIPFQAIDLATDEKARRLWQRRAHGKKLPGLVKDGFVLGDIEDVEEWSEFGELNENIGQVPSAHTAPAGSSIQGISTAPPINHNIPPQPAANTVTQPMIRPANVVPAESVRIALPGAAEISALNRAKREKETAAKETAAAAATSDKAEQRSSREISINHPALDHLSAPPSAMQSGAATPRTGVEAADAAPSEIVPEVATKDEKAEQAPVKEPVVHFEPSAAAERATESSKPAVAEPKQDDKAEDSSDPLETETTKITTDLAETQLDDGNKIAESGNEDDVSNVKNDHVADE